MENEKIDFDGIIGEIDLNDFDKTMFQLNGNKKKLLGPDKYMPSEYIEIDGEFYYFDTQTNTVRLIKVTYIRSGVYFYTIEDESHEIEYFAPIECFFTKILEPKIYVTNINTDYYKFESRWGKSEIIYVKKENNNEKDFLKTYKNTRHGKI